MTGNSMIETVPVAGRKARHVPHIDKIHDTYPNGQVKYEGTLCDGLFEGVYHEYFDNGRMKKEIEHTEGQRHGIYRQWTYGGTLVRDEVWKQDVKIIDNLKKDRRWR